MSEQPCAFHPDRLTGVSCARCARPICPDDMIDAPVGIQCPVCAGRMREGALGRAGYRARTRIEGAPGARHLRGVAITPLLIGGNLAVFALMMATGRPTAADTLIRFGALFDPLERREWWRLFSSMFVHIGFGHLLFNMFALYLFGGAIETRYGKGRFVALYLSSGLLGAAASLAFTSGGIRAGASGGVFGVLGAWVAFYAQHRSSPVARGQLQSLFFLIGINLFFGFTVAGVDNAAHVGGLIAGAIVGTGLEVSAKRRSPGAAMFAPAAYAVVIVLAVVLVLPNSV